MKSEKQKDSELQITKTQYKEANERLAQEIHNKNFSEVAVAQELLEVAKRKMENGMDKSSVHIRKWNWTKGKRLCWRIVTNMCLPRRGRAVPECERLVIVTKILQEQDVKCIDK